MICRGEIKRLLTIRGEGYRSLSYPKMSDNIDIKGSLNRCITAFQQMLARNNTRIVDNHGHIADRGLNLEEVRRWKWLFDDELLSVDILFSHIRRYFLSWSDHISSRGCESNSFRHSILSQAEHYLLRPHPTEQVYSQDELIAVPHLCPTHSLHRWSRQFQSSDLSKVCHRYTIEVDK